MRDLKTKPQATAMVQSLVVLAHNIGMKVIVEGVEDATQLHAIQELGCNDVQGYLLGRPTPAPAGLLVGVRREVEAAVKGEATASQDQALERIAAE